MTRDPDPTRSSPTPPSPEDGDDDLELPRALRSDLEALDRPRGQVPDDVDRRLRSLARETLAPIRERRGARRWGWAAGAAAAAALALLALPAVLEHFSGPSHLAPEVAMTTPAAPEDLDHSGRVDILDAFWLARRIDRGLSLDRGWDFDGDGDVTAGDVDHLAALAVR